MPKARRVMVTLSEDVVSTADEPAVERAGSPLALAEDALRYLRVPDLAWEEASPEEMAAIERGRAEIARGEFVTLEEIKGDLGTDLLEQHAQEREDTGPMDAGARKRLIAALRSGQFRQIRGRLHDGLEGHCVMGVARRIGADRALAPDEVGLVISLNDTGSTFEEIADRLERGDLVASHQPPTGLPGCIDAVFSGARWLAELRAGVPHDGDDEPPPAAPAVVYIYPKRPWLAGGVAEKPRRRALEVA